MEDGEIRFDGSPVKSASVRGAIDSGISHVPENRMKSGLAGRLGSVDNLLFKSYRSEEHSRFGILKRQEPLLVTGAGQPLQCKDAGAGYTVQQLSGGNQQKLLVRQRSEPPSEADGGRSSDAGAGCRCDGGVHELLMELRGSGSGVLLISEDLDELLQLSDRILVIYNGSIIGEETHDSADREAIGLLMSGFQGREGSVV